MLNEHVVNVRQLPTAERPSGERWFNRFFKWEVLTVAGRTIEKGFVITPAMAMSLVVLLLGVVFGVLGYAYKSSQSDNRETRDAIIEMKTMLNERTTVFKEEQAEMKTELKNEQAEMRTKLDNEVKLADMRREQALKERLQMLAALRQKGIIITE